MKVTSLASLTCATLTVGFASSLSAQTAIVGTTCAPGGGPPQPTLIYEIVIATGAVNTTVPISAGDCIHGFDQHPVTGELYALIRNVTGVWPSGTPDRELCTVNPVTGAVTLIGPITVEFMNSIAFDSSGTLWATSGYTAETLWTIDINTAVATFVMTLSQNGNNGDTLGYNPDDGLLYHGSGGIGGFGAVSPLSLESIDPVTLVSTPIPVTNPSLDEWLGMAYMGNNTFLVADLNWDLYSLTTAGVNTFISTSVYYFRGVTIPGSVPLGTNYCTPAIPNSTGAPGVISATGSLSVVANDVALTAAQLPNGQFGYFLTSLTPGFFMPPGSIGFICLGGNIGRYNCCVGQGPSFSLLIDLTSMPVNPPQAVFPGETWNFQAWYRDVGNTNNFTDGLSVTFQ